MNLPASLVAAALTAGLAGIALRGHVGSRVAATTGALVAGPAYFLLARRLELLAFIGLGVALVVVAMDAWRWRLGLVLPAAFVCAILAPPIGLPLLTLPLVRAPTTRLALAIGIAGIVAAVAPIAWGAEGIAPRFLVLAFSALLSLAAGSVLGRWRPGRALRDVAAIVAGAVPIVAILATLWLLGRGTLPATRLPIALLGALAAAALLVLLALGTPVLLATRNHLREPALAWTLQAVAATVLLSPLAAALLVYPVVAAVAVGMRVIVLRNAPRPTAEARFI